MKIISRGRARKNEADSHREFPGSRILADLSTPLDYFGALKYVPMYRQPATYGIRKGRRPLSYHTSELLVCIQIDGIIRLQIQEQKMYIRYKVYTEWYIKVDDVRFFVFLLLYCSLALSGALIAIPT